MRGLVLSLLAALMAAVPAQAQEAAPEQESLSGAASGSGMGKLLSQGYEIRAAVPNGTRYIVFLQKEQSAYACEFVSLTKSRCGTIN